MSDAMDSPLPEVSGAEAEPASAAGHEKLDITAAPARERPVTNLGKVFGQFAELQQQIAEHVVALEDSVCRQREDLSAAVSRLPEIRERVDSLIASFSEQSRKDESLRQKLDQHDVTIARLVEAVRGIYEAQMQWQSAVEDILGGLMRAKAASVPRIPEF